MKFFFEQRASTILYKIISSLPKNKYFLLPANVCPIVVAVFLKAGVKYEFVDISSKTLCLDEQIVLDRLKKNTDAYSGVLFVRTYGTPADFESFFSSIKEVAEHVIVIDDKCLTVPDFNEIRFSAADVELFSTGYSKYVDIGWGGFAFADERLTYCSEEIHYSKRCLELLEKKIKQCIQQQKRFDYNDSDWLDGERPTISFNEYKVKILGEISTVREEKLKINKIYLENIPDYVQLPLEFQDWRFNIVVPERDALLEKIFDSGLFAGTNYPSLAHIFGDTQSQIADALACRVLNLFNDKCFSQEKAYRIAEIVTEHLAKRFKGQSCLSVK